MSGIQKRTLPILLIFIGVAFILLPAMTMLFPASWMWEPRQSEYETMILGIYVTLGVFLLIPTLIALAIILAVVTPKRFAPVAA